MTPESSARHLIVVVHGCHVAARDRTSGALVWRNELPCGVERNASLAIHRGCVYVATPQPALYAMDYATGRGLWRQELRTGPYTTPPLLMVDDDQVVVCAHDALECFASDGRPLWHTPHEVRVAPGTCNPAIGLPGNVLQAWKARQ